MSAVADAFAPGAALLRFLTVERLPPQELRACDLVVLQLENRSAADQVQAITAIRNFSRAPIVLLTAHKSAAEDLDVLLAGADAVIPLHTTPPVIVAHCLALLRRWQAH